MADLLRGTQIAYIPMHAEEWAKEHPDSRALDHPDVEFGFVTSGPVQDGTAYFCRYWRKGFLGDLRTKSCSECTPFDCMVTFISVPQAQVVAALEIYCS